MQVCWYFPIRPKLRKLLSLPQFRTHLCYEQRRPRNDLYVTDVMDAARWHRVMGPFGPSLRRIALQFCVDGIPAFVSGSVSIKPAEFMILSLPPKMRSKARNMLLCMLLPDSLKGPQQRKYYDWAATYEMNDLHTRGVGGVRVIVYGTSLDSPGRAELMQIQSATAYYNCPYCYICNAPGIRSKPVYGGFRRFLGSQDPWRQRSFIFRGQRYMFDQLERLPPPPSRSGNLARACVEMATPRCPFRGHKSIPLLAKWKAFDWEMGVCESMHDIKNVCVMTLKILVGQGGEGFYATWAKLRKDEEHRMFCRVHDVFPEVHDERNPLPWRLSRESVDMLNTRVNNIFWPHYMDVLCVGSRSFWKAPSACWKSRNKSMIYLVILPTCLRDCVTAVHQALLMVIYALRRLDGQCVSETEAIKLGVLPGSRLLDKRSLGRIHKDLIRGLVLLEGSLPACHLNPLLHRFVHYAPWTAKFGCLSWFAMYAFERYNKKIKSVTRNRSLPLESIANNMQIEISTRFLELAEETCDLNDDGVTSRLVGKPAVHVYVFNFLYVVLLRAANAISAYCQIEPA